MNIKGYVEGDFSQIERLDLSELRAVLRAMNAAANKRIMRLEKAGVADYSPALADRNWERFSSKRSPERQQLLGQIAEVRAFLLRTKGEIARARKNKEEVYAIFDFDDSSWPSGLSWKELMDWVYNGSPVEGDAITLGSQRVSILAYHEASGKGSTANLVAAIRSEAEALRGERERYDLLANQFTASRDGGAGSALYNAAQDEIAF